MDYIKNKKIEPESFFKGGHYSLTKRVLISGGIVATAIATPIFLSNSLIANSHISKGHSKKEIEKIVQMPNSYFANASLNKLLLQSPIAKHGRNLVYFVREDEMLERQAALERDKETLKQIDALVDRLNKDVDRLIKDIEEIKRNKNGLY